MTRNSNRPIEQAAELLTVGEVAVLLRVGIATAYGLVRDGTIPAARVGRAYRIRLSDVTAWLESGGGGAIAGTD